MTTKMPTRAELVKLQALTLWPEWVPPVLFGDKPVENRPMALPKSVTGRWVAIHAGKHIGGRAGRVAHDEAAAAISATSPGLMLKGQSLTRQLDDDWTQTRTIYTSAICGLVRFTGYHIGRRDVPWESPGAFCWDIADAIPLATPVPIGGAQGFWYVSENVIDQIWAQLTAREPVSLFTGADVFGSSYDASDTRSVSGES